MQFKYSKQAYKPLWFLLIVTWATVVLNGTGSLVYHNATTLFLMLFGFVATFTLIFLTILDIIEWRYP